MHSWQIKSVTFINFKLVFQNFGNYSNYPQSKHQFLNQLHAFSLYLIFCSDDRSRVSDFKYRLHRIDSLQPYLRRISTFSTQSQYNCKRFQIWNLILFASIEQGVNHIYRSEVSDFYSDSSFPYSEEACCSVRWTRQILPSVMEFFKSFQPAILPLSLVRPISIS